MSTVTRTSTYTTADVARVVDRFAADFHMVAQATGLSDRVRVADVAHDVKLMTQRGYVDSIDIVLGNSYGEAVRAAKYTVSTDASGWACDRPGANLWPRQIGGTLLVIVSYTATWWTLSEEQRRIFVEDECIRYWGPSDIDTSYPGMVVNVDRRYASNAYGLERQVYRRND